MHVFDIFSLAHPEKNNYFYILFFFSINMKYPKIAGLPFFIAAFVYGFSYFYTKHYLRGVTRKEKVSIQKTVDEESEYSLFENEHIGNDCANANSRSGNDMNRYSNSNSKVIDRGGSEKNGDYSKIDVNSENFDTDNSITVNPMTLSVRSGTKNTDSLNFS